MNVSDVASRRSEYESAGLDVADLDADPLRQWQRWYDEAVAAGVTEPNAMALSTLGEDGVPDVRYVLVRGVDERGLAFYTNLTSAKARQLRRASVGGGGLRLAPAAPPGARARRASSASPTPSPTPTSPRARAARAIGAWASPQSHAIADRAELDALVRAADERFPGDDVPRPAHWGGFRIVPERDRVLAGPAEPPPRPPALPPLGRRPGRSSASRPDAAERTGPGAADAAPGPGAVRAGYTLPRLTTSPLPALVP